MSKRREGSIGKYTFGGKLGGDAETVELWELVIK